MEPLISASNIPSAESTYPLLAIVGPTAAGKSALALALAERWAGEIVNYDSMQLYRGFNIGTGKLSPDERRGVPHHLLDCVEPHQVFTAGDYAREAARTLASIRDRAKLPILVGGTGLYLRALLDGLFEGPGRSETLRARLKAMAGRRGRQFLHRLLRRLDPRSAARIQPQDTQKITRAIEVCLLARQPFSSLLARGRRGLAGFRTFKIGLSPDRPALDRRINARVEDMFAAGLMAEARALLESAKSLPLERLGRQGPFASIGYPQAMAAVRGEISEEEAIREAQQATRQYAKRQRTWFRRERDVTWFSGFGDDPSTQRQIVEWLEATDFNPMIAAAAVRLSVRGSAAPAS